MQREVAALVKASRSDLRNGPTRSLIEEIDTIRHAEGRAYKKHRLMANVVLDDLESTGRLIRTSSDDLYFFHKATKRLESIESCDFKAMLGERYGLNPIEAERRYIEHEIRTRALCHGERVELQHVDCWNEARQALYVSANDGTMFILDGKGTYQRVDNGVDGILFQCEQRTDPITPNFSASKTAFDRIFEGLSLDENTRYQSLALLKVWTLGLFFIEALPVRPIVVLLGERGLEKPRWVAA